MKEFKVYGKAASPPERTSISSKSRSLNFFLLMLIRDVYPGSGIQNPDFLSQRIKKGTGSHIRKDRI
jgi:hypothetical protein